MERFPLTDYEILEVIRRRDQAGVPDVVLMKWIGLSGSTWLALIKQAEEGSS